MKKLLLLVLIFFMSGTSYLLAQSAVTGKVTDENGDGIPGANIIIKGTRTGSVTDFDGNYSWKKKRLKTNRPKNPRIQSSG